MAPLAPIQTVQGYFQPAQQANLSQNLLKGMDTASMMQYRKQATETDKQRLKLEQEKYDAEKAAKQEEMAQSALNDALAYVNASDPAAFTQTLSSQIPILEQQINKMFPDGLPPRVAGGMESLKQIGAITDPKQLDAARTSVQQYQQKMGITATKTPEQMETEAYGKERGKRKAMQEFPDTEALRAPVRGSPEWLANEEKVLRQKQQFPGGRDSYFQFAGTDDQGNPIAFNARTGKFQSERATGGINPKPSNLTAGEQTAAQGFNMLATNMQVIRDDFNPDWVGPVAGRVQKKAGEYINLPEKQQRWYTSLDSLGNILLYLRSGAQINETEYQRLKKELPDAKYSKTKFIANYNNFMDQLEDIILVKAPSIKRKGVDPKKLLNSLPQKIGEELIREGTAAPGSRVELDLGNQEQQRTVVRTGIDKSTGKKVIQYSDGSIEDTEVRGVYNACRRKGHCLG